MPAPASSLARARALLEEHPLVDGHNDFMWEVREQVGYDLDRLDLASRLTTTHTDLPRLREGGVGAQFWSVFVPGSLQGETAVVATLEQVDGVRRLVEAHPDALVLATTADDVERAAASGRVASLLGAEGGHSIGCSLGALRALFALGVRYLTLTHNENVPWADSATDVPRAGGLTAFGREVVAEMNRLGMMVDLSHVAATTMRDALDATRAPVIFSHSSARAVCDVPRNVPDDVLGRLPDNGGVCMVTFVPEFVSPATARWRERAYAAAESAGVDTRDWTRLQQFLGAYRDTDPKPDATIEDVVAHVEHVREAAGLAHVGLGGDYDGTDTFPLGLEDVASYPRLVAALLDRRWSPGEVAALARGNVLRVMRDVEAVARQERSRRPAGVRTFAEVDRRADGGPAAGGVTA